MPHPPWNERYASGELPWDTGHPDPLLVTFVESGGVAPGRALEIGCGTGTNAIWLAERGFDVLAVDVSPLAIEKARAKLQAKTLQCKFATMDFLGETPPSDAFDFVFDRGCFHIFDDSEERSRFATRVAKALAPSGKWLSLIGSTEGALRDTGPPRRSAREVVSAIEPDLEILDLHSAEFRSKLDPAKAWFCLSRRRTVSAQPSTRRG